MDKKEKKSGCISTLLKVFGILIALSIIFSFINVVDRVPKDQSAQANVGRSSRESPPQNEKAAPKTISVPETPLNLAEVPRSDLPKEVRLRETVEFAGGSGNIDAPAGTVVKLLALSGDTVTLDFAGVQATSKVENTDIRERILNARKIAQEVEKAKTEAARLAAENAAKEEAELKAIREANFKKLEAEIGMEPLREGWKQNEPPGVIRRHLKKILRDPDSLQFIEAWPAVVTEHGGQKCWMMKFSYRAKNGFGGYVGGEAVGYIRGKNLIGFKGGEGQ